MDNKTKLGLAIGVGVTAIVGGIVALIKRGNSSEVVIDENEYAETEFDYSEPTEVKTEE